MCIIIPFILGGIVVASLHRLQWIDECIRHNKYPNITQIVERFEISRRQALRDVEYLRDSLGAPIKYNAKYQGYFTLMTRLLCRHN
jgi:predicted DNA-binding transcriptional regulator YafY